MISAVFFATFLGLFQSDLVEVNALQNCPPSRNDCLIAVIDWDLSAELPVHTSSETQTINLDDGDRILEINRHYRAQVTARLNGADSAEVDLNFSIFTAGMYCGGFDQAGTGYWALAGWSDTGNPILFTDQGELEILSSGPATHGHSGGLLLIDAISFERVADFPIFRDWGRRKFINRNSVVMEAGYGDNSPCIEAPRSTNGRISPAEVGACDGDSREDGRTVVDDELSERVRVALIETHPSYNNATGSFTQQRESYWPYAVFRFDNDPTTLIVDGRIACT